MTDRGMTHILLIIPRFAPFWGGTELRMRAIAEALSARGFRFTVLTRRLKWALPAEEDLGGIHVVRLPASLPLFRFFARRWIARHAGDIDLIHSFRLDKTGMIGAWAAEHCALPHLAEAITNEAEKMLLNEAGRAALQRIAKSGIIHALSAGTAAALTAAGIAGERIWLRGNAVDVSLYRPGPPHSDFPLTVLCCGRIERQKGSDILIAAWNALPAATRAKARLVLVGTGKWEGRIRAAASGDKSVVFAGTVAKAQMPAQYRTAQIYVQPSRFEGMSNAILEAMACGLPILSTSIGANRGVIENGVNGILVPPDDAPALSAELGRLIEDAAL
ncbi:MAG: glycosyltransferase family 4 protein, partial [Rhizomicrobium sp.]